MTPGKTITYCYPSLFLALVVETYPILLKGKANKKSDLVYAPETCLLFRGGKLENDIDFYNYYFVASRFPLFFFSSYRLVLLRKYFIGKLFVSEHFFWLLTFIVSFLSSVGDIFPSI